MNELDLSDTIERSIVIKAPIQQVWKLVATPGWWINGGEIVENTVAYSGTTATVDSAVGKFIVEVVELREPHLAAFRWNAGTNPGHNNQQVHTMVEFHVAETDGGIELRVVESGWASTEATEFVRNNYRENCSGWEEELAAAQRFFE